MLDDTEFGGEEDNKLEYGALVILFLIVSFCYAEIINCSTSQLVALNAQG